MPLLANFPQSAALGFQQGTEMGQGQNPLGQFVRSMLADWQQRKAMETEYGMKKGLIEEEAKARQKYPTPWEAYITNQLQKEGKIGGLATTEEEGRLQIPAGENPEDYNFKIETRSIKGVPQTIYRPEKKPLVPPAQQKELNQLKQTRLFLERNLNTLKNKPDLQKFIGPGIVQRPGALADIIAQMGGSPKDFVTFKADVDKAFQRYRKEVTGVQAGYPELQWLAPDLPKTTDTSENFISKSLSSIEQLKKAEEMLTDTWGKSGYAVGRLRKEVNPNPIIEQNRRYSPDEEQLIQDNIHKWGKSRKEIIEALVNRGYL